MYHWAHRYSLSMWHWHSIKKTTLTRLAHTFWTRFTWGMLPDQPTKKVTTLKKDYFVLKNNHLPTQSTKSSTEWNGLGLIKVPKKYCGSGGYGKVVFGFWLFRNCRTKKFTSTQRLEKTFWRVWRLAKRPWWSCLLCWYFIILRSSN